VLHRWLADLVVVIHCLVGVFFLLGAFLAWRFPWVALFHIPLAIWVTAAFLLGWTCPLTPLENRLRRLAGEQGYDGSFVDHYLGRFVGMSPPDDSTALIKNSRRNEVILGLVFSTMTVILHGVNVGNYHDAIWPPQSKPPGAVGAP
jgi:hypothetical protein